VPSVAKRDTRSDCPQLQPRHRETKEKEDFMGLTGIERADD
jgi:hypothetical protein